MRTFGLLLAVALAGCAAERPTAAPLDDVPVAEPPSASALASLGGEWRVAGIDGKPFDEPYGLALSASGSEIWWSPKCAGFVRTYRLDGVRARFAPPAPSPANDGRAAPVCLIAIPARLGAVFEAIDAAERAVRTPSNGVEISGGGHSLLLFSQ